MKYIDAELLRKEIERRRLQNRYIDTDGYEQELFEIIDSLQQEQPSGDLEKEIEKASKRFPEVSYAKLARIAKRFFIIGAEWQNERDTREMVMSDGSYFQKCYELGKKDMKEQMMKDAVEGKIYGYDDGSFELIASWLDMPKNSVFKDGDEVKIIIVKEHQH